MTNILKDGERINKINDDLVIIERCGGLLFGTDALLLAAYLKPKANGCALELGGGSGVISLLAATRGKFKSITCAEIQPAFADIIRRNIELNQLGEKVRCVCADIRDDHLLGEDGTYDVVFSNPPYMTASSGASCSSDEKNTARHEVYGDISDFCRVASKKLRYGGKFFCVYRAERIADLIYAMKARAIEPKSLTFVHPDTSKKPSMVLISGVRGGKSGCVVTRPFIIYKSASSRVYSDEMEDLLSCGNMNL